jgi:hypothetical protein
MPPPNPAFAYVDSTLFPATNYPYALPPVDCDEDQFKAFLYGVQTAQINSGAAMTVAQADALNAVYTFTNAEGVAPIWFLWEGIDNGTGTGVQFVNVEITTNWEVIPKERTLVYTSQQMSTQTSNNAASMAMEALAPVATSGAFAGPSSSAADGAGPSVFDALSNTMKNVVNGTAKGGDLGSKFGETLTEGVGEFAADLPEILGGLAALF